MLQHTNAQPNPTLHRASLVGGFATPREHHIGVTHHGNPPQAQIQIQAQTQTQHKQPPLTSPASLLKQAAYGARLALPTLLSANINLSPTSTAGSSGPPPSLGRTAPTATSVSNNPNEMEDEPRDFAELPKTSPHFNTHLLLPFPNLTRHHQPPAAAAAGAGQPHDQQDDFLRPPKLSFAPIFAPVEIIPYGADRVLFVEGLICESFLFFIIIHNFGTPCANGLSRGVLPPIHAYSATTDSLDGFGNPPRPARRNAGADQRQGHRTDWASGMTNKSEGARRLFS